MEILDLDNDVTRVVLNGDLDAKGSGEIDLQFQTVAAARRKVVVDMAQVGFLASIGIRTLIMGAKANAGKGGKLVLLDANDMVRKVLATCGADGVLPCADGLDKALTLLH